jgi:PBP1b-binding outer membrane lipoprotein LpoB
MKRSSYKTPVNQILGWVVTILIVATIVLSLTGCASSNPDAGKISVAVTKTEQVFVMVPESLLDTCTRPERIDSMIPDLKIGQVKEKSLVSAFILSRTNEVNCWLVKQEVTKLQLKMKAAQTTGK